MLRARRSSRGKLKWILLLVLPPALLLGTAAVLAVWGRELYHSEAVARAQSAGGREILFGPAYSSPEVSYKFSRITMDAPEILVLGSSRVLPFRREFFDPTKSFYNGGRIARDVWILRQTLERLPLERHPDLLIVGLDQYNFNSAESDYRPEAITPAVVAHHFREREEGWERFGEIWPEILQDTITGKIRFAPDPEPFEAIGMNAKVNGSGFRNDGSYRYGQILLQDPSLRNHAERMSSTLERIARGGSRFAPGDSVNRAVVDEVERLADWCEAKGVKVVAFLPPYAPSAVGAMHERAESYSYLELLPVLLEPVFASRGQTFLDCTSFPGAADAEFTDGFHGGELLYAKLLLVAAEESEPLARAIDRRRLENLVENARDPLDPLSR